MACDGAEALEVFGRLTIDVVVTDIQMPNVDGLELIAALRAVSPAPPVIAVSGAGEDGLRRARVAGAAATFKKPIEPQELLSAISEAMREPERRDIG